MAPGILLNLGKSSVVYGVGICVCQGLLKTQTLFFFFPFFAIERHSHVARQVKDPALSLLWHRFDPWLRNFCMSWVWPKGKFKKKKRKPDWTLQRTVTETFLYSLLDGSGKGQNVLSLWGFWYDQYCGVCKTHGGKAGSLKPKARRSGRPWNQEQIWWLKTFGRIKLYIGVAVATPHP